MNARRSFVIYAPIDQALRDQFEKHLSPLRHEGLIGPIEEHLPGDDLPTLLDRLDEADQVLLLLSSDLLASIDLNEFFDRPTRRARVIPVLVRDVHLPAQLSALDCLPQNNRPVTSSEWTADEGWSAVVAKLRRQLQNPLPAGTLAVAPSAMPPNNLPRPPLYFVGREDDLVALEQMIAGGATTIWGLPGIGKSWLALEYAYRNGRRYPGGIFWVRASGDPEHALALLAPDMAALLPSARPILALAGNESSVSLLARQVRLALQNQVDQTLLILDSINQSGWSDHLPGGTVSILASTLDRSLVLPGIIRGLDAPPLDVALKIGGPESSEREEREAKLRVVRDRLGCLPLAVAISARGTRRWNLRWTQYEALLAEGEDRLLNDDRVLGGYPRGVFAALDLTLACCADSLAQRVLVAASLFAPDRIPLSWVLDTAGLQLNFDLQSALATLEDLAIISQAADGPTISVHQLVQFRARLIASQPQWDELRKQASSVLLCWFLNNDIDLTFVEIDKRRLHIESVLTHVEDMPTYWGFLAERFAKYLLLRGEHLHARDIFSTIVAKEEKKWGEKSPLLVLALSGLGRALLDGGDAQGAKVHIDRAINLGVNIRGTDSLPAAQGFVDLALTLHELGDFPQARTLLERAIALNEQLGTPELKAANLANLCLVLCSMGDLAGARQYAEQGVAMARQILGDDHPRTAKILSNLASALQALGALDASRQHFERALVVLEKWYGPVHPEVALRLNNLAGILEDLHKPQEAIQMRRRALQIADETMGPQHPKTAKYLANLASLTKNLGKPAEALLMLTRALQIQEQRLPAGQADFVATLGSLAAVHYALGDGDEAFRCIRWALLLQEQAGQIDRPDYAATLTSLAELLCEQERPSVPEALEALLRALGIVESCSAPEQTLLIRILHRLASTYHLTGNVEKCREYLQRLLSILEKKEGQEGLDVAECLWNLAALEPTAEVASNQLERALRIYENGEKNPQIARCAYRLALLQSAKQNILAVRQLVERGLAAAQRSGDSALIAQGHFRLASALLSTCSANDIERHLKEALRHTESHPREGLHIEAFAHLYLLPRAVRSGRIGEARCHANWLRAHRADERISSEIRQMIAELLHKLG